MYVEKALESGDGKAAESVQSNVGLWTGCKEYMKSSVQERRNFIYERKAKKIMRV